jgi:hypothetical protein
METKNVVLNSQSEEVIKFWQDSENQMIHRDCNLLDIVIDDLMQKTYELCDFNGKTATGNEDDALRLFEKIRGLNDIRMKIKSFALVVES